MDDPSGAVAVVVVAAGAGVRFSGGEPKALARLGGQSLVRRAAATLARVGGVGRLIVVVPPGPGGAKVAEEVSRLHPRTIVVEGGARRRDSVLAGVGRAEGAPFVLVHDAARALVTEDLAERVLAAAREFGAAVPAVPSPDALVREDGGMVGDEIPRHGVHAVQTPQAFARDVLLAAHAAADPAWDAPDDGGMVHASGRPVALVLGETDNIKITWPDDIPRAEALLAARTGGPMTMTTARVGLGWDVHPLAAGRRTVLAGVTLSELFGPVGHSDGDPLAHAVCDALLGAAALGDIGQLFPDTDPRWKRAPGAELLEQTCAVLAEAGWRPVQVDAVVIADEPVIAPHRTALRTGLARALGLPLDAVSVKGKRTEGLGALAGGKGIACHAVAVVERLAAGAR